MPLGSSPRSIPRCKCLVGLPASWPEKSFAKGLEQFGIGLAAGEQCGHNLAALRAEDANQSAASACSCRSARSRYRGSEVRFLRSRRRRRPPVRLWLATNGKQLFCPRSHRRRWPRCASSGNPPSCFSNLKRAAQNRLARLFAARTSGGPFRAIGSVAATADDSMPVMILSHGANANII